jgi:adenylyl-sulfate kinase
MTTTYHSGTIVWFTGLPGAGKSTLAQALCQQLERAVVIDGDEVREHFSKGLGFSREGRDTNVRRIGYAARLVARTGGTALCAAISPYEATRDEVRRLAESEGHRFLLVHVTAPLEVLEARDPKGLWAKARAGQLRNFTGVDDPYEVPHVSLTLDTAANDLGKCLELLQQALG